MIMFSHFNAQNPLDTYVSPTCYTELLITGKLV